MARHSHKPKSFFPVLVPTPRTSRSRPHAFAVQAIMPRRRADSDEEYIPPTKKRKLELEAAKLARAQARQLERQQKMQARVRAAKKSLGLYDSSDGSDAESSDDEGAELEGRYDFMYHVLDAVVSNPATSFQTMLRVADTVPELRETISQLLARRRQKCTKPASPFTGPTMMPRGAKCPLCLGGTRSYKVCVHPLFNTAPRIGMPELICTTCLMERAGPWAIKTAQALDEEFAVEASEIQDLPRYEGALGRRRGTYYLMADVSDVVSHEERERRVDDRKMAEQYRMKMSDRRAAAQEARRGKLRKHLARRGLEMPEVLPQRCTAYVMRGWGSLKLCRAEVKEEMGGAGGSDAPA
ncbi:unnamed protein product [Pedinophyceae sp. YPF-701]|nr:unnamed protein product [Pedinophyceae sp. YPF-701]